MIRRQWKVFGILTGIITLVFFAIPGGAEEPYYSVELIKTSTQAALEKKLSSIPPLLNLWENKTPSIFSLRAGIYPDRRGAILCLNSLKGIFPNATVIKSQIPRPSQWLPVDTRITLSDLGFRAPLLAQGIHPYQEFRIPWLPRYSLEGSRIALFLRFSPMLKNRSTVTIQVNGIPIKSFKLTDLNTALVNVPLNSLKDAPIGDTLDVVIRGYFTITGDRCVDTASGNLWMLIDNKSFFEIKELRPPDSVRDFFMAPSRSLNVISDGNMEGNIEAICNLAILSGSAHPSLSHPMTVHPYDPRSYNIFIGPFKRDAAVYGYNLYLTPRGEKTLQSRWLKALIFQNIKRTSVYPFRSSPIKNIPLSKLGYNDGIMRGIGELTTRVFFSPSQLGGWPGRLLCTLFYVHSPINNKERAFIKVRINGALIESQEIKGQGGVHAHTFRIPGRYIQAKNTLEIAFAYYRNSGDCQGSFPEMEATVFKDSFLTIQAYRKHPPLKIGTFPVICSGNGALILDSTSPKSFRPLLPILEMLGKAKGPLPTLSLANWKKFKKNHFAFGLFDVKKIPQGLKPWVYLNRSLIIIDPTDRKPLLRVDAGDSAAIIQTFYTKGEIPVILYSQKGGASFTPSHLLKVISQNQLANVLLLSHHEWYGLEIGQKMRVIYPEAKNFSFYMSKYRLFIFIFLGVVIFLLLFFLFHKLASRQD